MWGRASRADSATSCLIFSLIRRRAHDALQGYVPNGMPYAEAMRLRRSDPQRYVTESMRTMGEHVRAMLELQRRGAVTFDYGNNIRGQAKLAGVNNAFDIEGFVPRYIRPLFCEGQGPFRWAALSGDPCDMRVRIEPFWRPSRITNTCAAGFALPGKRVAFQGLPARICWLGYGERAKMGLIFNELVGKGEISARSSLGAIIWIVAAWLRPTGRRRA